MKKIIIATKSDLSSQFKVDPKEVKEFCESLGGIPFIETSAKTGYNVDLAVRNLTQQVFFQVVAKHGHPTVCPTFEMVKKYVDHSRSSRSKGKFSLRIRK